MLNMREGVLVTGNFKLKGNLMTEAEGQLHVKENNGTRYEITFYGCEDASLL